MSGSAVRTILYVYLDLLSALLKSFAQDTDVLLAICLRIQKLTRHVLSFSRFKSNGTSLRWYIFFVLCLRIVSRTYDVLWFFLAQKSWVPRHDSLDLFVLQRLYIVYLASFYSNIQHYPSCSSGSDLKIHDECPDVLLFFLPLKKKTSTYFWLTGQNSYISSVVFLFSRTRSRWRMSSLSVSKHKSISCRRWALS
jgi:hypothetical protein